MSRLCRLLVTAAVLILALAGCSRGESQTATAETEGLYLDVNGLKYQVQLSRYLNPNDVEDREYLAGLPEGTTEPGPDETWFGVWVRVQNTSDEARPSATTWEIHDTQEKVYRPVPNDSVFAYQPTTVAPGQILPRPDSASGQGPVQGALLLFRVTNESLQNRPLELIFSNGAGSKSGMYHLDV